MLPQTHIPSRLHDALSHTWVSRIFSKCWVLWLNGYLQTFCVDSCSVMFIPVMTCQSVNKVGGEILFLFLVSALVVRQEEGFPATSQALSISRLVIQFLLLFFFKHTIPKKTTFCGWAGICWSDLCGFSCGSWTRQTMAKPRCYNTITSLFLLFLVEQQMVHSGI